jgi:hypothetical protein
MNLILHTQIDQLENNLQAIIGLIAILQPLA